MKRKKTARGSRDIAVNILLAVIIAGLYLALILPYSGSSTVATAGYPIYAKYFNNESGTKAIRILTKNKAYDYNVRYN